MKKNAKTKQQFLLEMEELRTRVDATERRLQEANETIQVEIAKRKRAEETFTEAQKYAESIVETIREPLLVLDSDLRVLSANRSFYESFKVTPNETIGNLIYDLGNRQWDIPSLRTLLEDILPKNNKFDNYEVEHVFSSIGHKIMLLNARRIIQKEIGSQMILLAIEDITKHRQLEILLSESEERYRRLFETADDGILLLEKREGNITHANPAIIKMLGYTKEECIGKKLKDIGLSLVVDDIKMILQELDKNSIIYYDNVPVQNKVGQTFYADIYMVDRARLVQCNIRNISVRKAAQEALRESEERFRLITETMTEVFWIADVPIEKMLYVNPAYELVWGRSCKSFYENPRSFLDAVHPADLERVLATLEIEKAGQPFDHKYRITRPDGSIRWIWDRGFPTQDKTGKVIRYVGVAADITERKRTEEALTESEKRLRSLSSQLLVAQEKERKLIAQEIHDSIGAALAATKFKMEDVITKVGENRPETRAALGSILPMLQEVIQEARRIQMALRPSILDDLGILATISWFCREFESIHSHINIRQEINIEESKVPDSLKTVIYRVLQEAMNNIAKHSKADRINLLLRKMDGAIELGIEDNGEGFDPEEALARIGTNRGFGLSSMRERTELSGGSFSIKSSKGAGTVIKAMWPIEQLST
jgi:PAS domain S-box-containing protein